MDGISSGNDTRNNELHIRPGYGRYSAGLDTQQGRELCESNLNEDHRELRDNRVRFVIYSPIALWMETQTSGRHGQTVLTVDGNTGNSQKADHQRPYRKDLDW